MFLFYSVFYLYSAAACQLLLNEYVMLCYVMYNQRPAHVYCGQTVAWIKMPFGTEVGLGPGHIVLDGEPAPPPPKKGIAAPAHVYFVQAVG